MFVLLYHLFRGMQFSVGRPVRRPSLLVTLQPSELITVRVPLHGLVKCNVNELRLCHGMHNPIMNFEG